MSTSSKNKIPVILLFGPTAAGKTALIGDVFHSDFEVINADSEQVYRLLSVGTAQPERSIRDRIPHHLVGILDPDTEFSVGDFVREADRLTAEIAARGNHPLIAGGTAYFLKHFVFGLPAAPKSDAAVRAALKLELSERGKDELYRELCATDPASAEKINQRDTCRVLRALEVFRQTGQPLSAFAPAGRLRGQYNFLFIGLALEREELAARIGERVEMMFMRGLAAEFGALLERGYTGKEPGLKGIGYRELFLMTKGCLSMNGVKELIALHTRQYAKRQMTFFRQLPGTRWFRPSAKDEIRECVRDFLRGKK